MTETKASPLAALEKKVADAKAQEQVEAEGKSAPQQDKAAGTGTAASDKS